jgi:hypothetical protein
MKTDTAVNDSHNFSDFPSCVPYGLGLDQDRHPNSKWDPNPDRHQQDADPQHWKEEQKSCRVDMSPTDVSLTENSWMLRPLNKAPIDIVSLTNVSRPWTASTMKLAPSAAIAASVGLQYLMNQWGVWPASPTPLTRFIVWRPSVGCTLGPHIELQSNLNLRMGWFGQGQNSQGTLCPRDATSKNFRSGTHRSGTD